MPLTPEDFEDREFLITLRGYDRDEVQSFLEEAARDYRAAIRAAEQARTPHDPYEAVGRDVTGILQAAREAAEKIVSDAERLRGEAEREADEVRERVKQEIASLKESTASAARQVKEEADKYATSVRERAQSDIDALKESTAAAARKVKEEAERYAAEVRARAENASAERDRLLASARDEADRYAAEVRAKAENAARKAERAAQERIERLKKTEEELTNRLEGLQKALSGVLNLGGATESPSQPETAAETPAQEPVPLRVDDEKRGSTASLESVPRRATPAADRGDRPA